MDFLIYLKIIVLIIILFICGFMIVRRICNDVRIQIILPVSAIAGIAIYVFLLNSIAYIIKGPPVFYTALVVEILLTFFLRTKSKTAKIIFPQKSEKFFWIITSVIWFVFLLIISATGNASSADWLHHSYFASLFMRGDFPIHSPFQPDRLSSYHVGVAEFLAALRFFTNGAYTFLGTIFSFIVLFAIVQILQWTLKLNSSISSLVFSIFIPLVAIVSLGNFMIVWPYQLSFPQIDNGIVNWLHNLPTLYNTYDPYGAPASLDSLNLFLHRMFALSIFSALIPLIIFPDKSKKILSSVIILIMISSLALADESVFIVVVPAIIAILFFTLFEKNIKNWILFCLIGLGLTIFQGGLVNEVIFKSDATIAKVLLFPDDEKNPAAKFEKYRSYRLEAQSSKMIPDKAEYVPFRWFHFGALWQIGALIIITIILTLNFEKKLKDKTVLYLMWLFCLSGIIALIAYHGIVPKGWTHINGNRFLSLSYQLSGLGIIIFIILVWINLKGKVGVKILLVWLLITSVIPPLALLFPRQKQNWFKIVSDTPKAEQIWIKNNLDVDTRILPFLEKFPTSGSILELVKNVGIFTPVWYEKPQAQGFDVSPPYLDLFFTQNPEILKILNVDYIMTNKVYRDTLSDKRLADLNNVEYFKVEYKDREGDVIISKVLPKYLLEAENYKGTFDELLLILPSKGAFFIEHPPGIIETVWRVAFLTLQMQDFKMFYSINYIPIYNFIINVDLKFNGESSDKYDYLVLGPGTDPVQICNCQTKLVWSHISGLINLWKVN